MRILLVAPGTRWSTFDVFAYHLDAMDDSDEVIVNPFNFHNYMSWQKLSTLYYRNEIGKSGLSEDAASAIGAAIAAEKLLADVITFQPDVVFVISGTLLPHFVWKHLVNLRNRLIDKFAIAIYFTESPYMDEMQKDYLQYVDIAFVNDQHTVNMWNPDGTYHIHYLPHSYNPKVHRRVEVDDEYKSDVFFVGTPFYERGKLLADVDWKDVKFLLGGNWADYCEPIDYLKLHKYNFREEVMDNDKVAKYYSGTKIGLNIHRTRMDIDGLDPELNNYTDAYSIGPRIYEMAASGAFIVSDYRKELIDIFGNSVAIFDSAKELERTVHYWLKEDNHREEMVEAALEQVSDCTFSSRLNNIILPVFDEVLSLR